MAKTTKADGASHTEAELNDPVLQRRPVRIRRPQIGQVDKETYSAEESDREVKSSPGINSSPSTDQQAPNDEPESLSPRQRARTTANRSKAPERGTTSGARSTAGSGRSNETKPSSDDDLFDDI